MTASVYKNTVSLYKCSNYNYPDIKHAVIRMGEDILGGWNTFIPSGARVLLKPNFLKPSTAEQVVSPHPSVVRAIAEVCMAAGAGRIVIGDSPGFGSAQKVAGKCGILEIAQDLGVEIVDFADSIIVPAPENFLHKNFTIARDAADADIIINIPKFKTHAMMMLTLSVKNLFGLFVGKQKLRWHLQSGRDYNRFARLLIELAYTVKPAVSILDAVIGMEGNGPGNGSPRLLGFLAASRDMNSLDRVAVEIVGADLEQMHTLQVAKQMGFNINLENITVTGDSIDSLRIRNFRFASSMGIDGPLWLRPLSWLLNRYMTTKPFVDRHTCIGCGVCMGACPAKSIDQPVANKPVIINHSLCIRCFCCQELCPEGAITVKDTVGVKLLKRMGLE